MKELISVITTVKNGENTLEETINSVINQTYKSFEYIVIDDGSTDNTVQILKQYENKYKKIKVIYTKGIGRSKALNLAIINSKGKYIANIDADDLMHPQRLEIQINYMKYNDKLFLISSPTEYIYNNQKYNIKKLTQNEINNAYKTAKKVTDLLLIRNTISHISILINKNELVKLGLYNENRLTQVDYDLWLRGLYENCKMEIVDLKLSAKRLHKNQSFENKKRQKYTYNSFKLQMFYIMKMKKYYFFPFSLMSYILSFLPLKSRVILGNSINKILKNL